VLKLKHIMVHSEQVAMPLSEEEEKTEAIMVHLAEARATENR
jgi:hypothetical protein